MRKRVVEKGNMRRSDYMRAVVTDTLPEEVPIIFSNDGYYTNAISDEVYSGPEGQLAEAVINSNERYTIPYRYNVLRDQFTTRGLSLLHPGAQNKVALFYQKFDALICYYAKKSSFSLRSPYKVGSTYFVKGPISSRNAYRAHSIDTVSIEKSVSNPASYFAYNRLSRAHQFFDSNEYLHLEKKFEIFRMLDVSKCFNSIYTHTMAWAVSDIKTAKDSVTADGFGNEFDKLMQSMNYNETNGICIGPEISRVFAELIFSDADKAVIEILNLAGLVFKNDYDVKRYVDDYYVFARSVGVADKVTAAIEVALSKFNLHLNQHKTQTIERPFSTQKSEIISAIDVVLSDYFSKFIDYKPVNETRFAYPKNIRRSDAVFRAFVSKAKAACLMHSANYEVVSDYIVAALRRRVVEIVDGHAYGAVSGSSEDEYVSSIMALIEASYFFYTVNPTVRASLNVARSIVASGKLFREALPTRMPFLSESIVRWTIDLVKSMNNGARHRDLTAVPIEVLNVLVPMREIAGNEPLIDSLISTLCEDIDKFEYFEIVTFLYLIGGRPIHRPLTTRLFSRAKLIVQEGYGPEMDAQAAHLCLDLLACPYLALDKRGAWFNTLRKRCSLPGLPRIEAQEAVVRMEGRPWFVRWSGVDLMSVLRKKELSAVY